MQTRRTTDLWPLPGANQNRNREKKRFSGKDADELAEALSTPHSPIRIEIASAGVVSYECDLASTGSDKIIAGSYTGDFIAHREIGTDKFCLLIPQSGAARYIVERREVFSNPSLGSIIDASRSGSLEMRGYRRHINFLIGQSTVRERLVGLLERSVEEIDFQQQIDLTRGSGVVLKGLVETMSQGLLMAERPLAHSPIALSNLSDSIVMMLLEQTQHRYSQDLAKPAATPAPWHVKRAMDFMRANLARPITIEDVANVCQVNIRTLQQGFKQFRNTTPKAFLHKLRMEAAHRHLCTAEPGQTVADIALKWGFTHLGRFAAEYRKRYGQLPSETLRKA